MNNITRKKPHLHKYLCREVRKKKRKRLLEPQWSKEIDEKSDDKTQDKAKSETDEEKDTMASIVDEESQGDSLESKVGTKCKLNVEQMNLILLY